jgi:hypothetical protein
VIQILFRTSEDAEGFLYIFSDLIEKRQLSKSKLKPKNCCIEVRHLKVQLLWVIWYEEIAC